MKLKVTDIQKLMQYLRNVAEVDPNDEIANRASSLAWRLEGAGTTFGMSDNFNKWSEDDQLTVRYAISKRNKYRLTPGARHAIIVS